MKANERDKKEKLFSLVKVSFLKKSFVTAILVISVFAMFTVAAVAGADDPPCTCGDICVNETGWWRADGDFNASNTPIQHAIDNATEGNTICVQDGTYTENVNVYKSLTIKSTSGNPADTTVQAVDESKPVFNVTKDLVNISGFTVTGAIEGIYLYSVEHCNISNNNVSNNGVGIILYSSNDSTLTGNNASSSGLGIGLEYSSDNTLTGNNVSSNMFGIALEYSSDNTLTDNNVSSNAFGIGLAASGNNTLRNNLMSDNAYNFEAVGSSYSELDNDIDTSNLVDGKPIYYLVDAADTVIDSATNAGTVYCIHCDNVTVKDLTLADNGHGVCFYNTSSSGIKNNDIDVCADGICLWRSNNISITGNDVYGGLDEGASIRIWESSDNTISDNNLSYSLGENIVLVGSDNNNIIDNNAIYSITGGIVLLYSSDNNTITGNTVSKSIDGSGIFLEDSGNNTLTNNTASENNFYGIELVEDSSNNLIYNNYFNNTHNAWDDGNNIWNITKTLGTNIIGGPYLGGNYWSDYAGKDLDGDGLGDTLLPYNSSGDIIVGGDYHPLTMPALTPTP